jgi:hypothetical protein
LSVDDPRGVQLYLSFYISVLPLTPAPKALAAMDSFKYNTNPSHVIFGSGKVKQLPVKE